MNRLIASKVAFAEKLVERLKEKNDIFCQERNICRTKTIQNLEETKIENSKAIQSLCQKIIDLDKPKDGPKDLEIVMGIDQITIFGNG